MALNRRLVPPAAAIRIALIVLANAVAIWFLWGLAHKPAQASNADTAGSASPLPARAADSAALLRAAAPKAATPAAEGDSTAQLAALGVKIRAIVERATLQASKLSKGRVAADSVHVAVHLRDPARGGEFGLDAGRAMRPASNMKIVTTVAALTLLGADWKFVTPIEARGNLRDGQLEGDLVVRASGDPLFDPDSDGAVTRMLAPAIDELERSGLRGVSGNLVLDEGSFDPPALAPGSPGADQRYLEYCALSGGFSANRG
jgi:D-alanyl-D-alanine carboxypeptidase/D-alanyl-D-alanine-endopeptidase (penicillin-binding protein 4)